MFAKIRNEIKSYQMAQKEQKKAIEILENEYHKMKDVKDDQLSTSVMIMQKFVRASKKEREELKKLLNHQRKAWIIIELPNLYSCPTIFEGLAKWLGVA